MNKELEFQNRQFCNVVIEYRKITRSTSILPRQIHGVRV